MDTRALFAWYRPRRRRYPWRRGRPDPYRILVSEVMLQQTQAARVARAYPAFIERFPDARALADASPGDVLRQWGGLGHNRRAIALAGAARTIVSEHGGAVPADPSILSTFPGIGPYTAAAVASLAFGAALPALDTNVRRVLARAELGENADRLSAREVERAAERALDRGDPAGWNQALMDLGRDLCRPVPRCEACPLASGCRFRLAGGQEAPGHRARPRAAPFEGSSRQVRGAIVAALRTSSAASVATLARIAGRSEGDVVGALRGLAVEGLVRAGPAALAGRSRGRARLPD